MLELLMSHNQHIFENGHGFTDSGVKAGVGGGGPPTSDIYLN